MVYVDEMQPCTKHKNWHWRWSCHLFADGLEELLTFGQRLGVNTRWLQHRTLVHYDLTAGMRAKAIKLGARPVSRQFIANFINKARAKQRRAGIAAKRAEVPHGE